MRLYCRYHDKELPFAVNLQKSQFLGMTESCAGDILYLIAEDIAVKMSNIIIHKLIINRVLQCQIPEITLGVAVETLIVLSYFCLPLW